MLFPIKERFAKNEVLGKDVTNPFLEWNSCVHLSKCKTVILQNQGLSKAQEDKLCKESK